MLNAIFADTAILSPLKMFGILQRSVLAMPSAERQQARQSETPWLATLSNTLLSATEIPSRPVRTRSTGVITT